ncbi:MAG TPA: hypothetical protein PLV70_12320, partial [Flavobacteriales bacterium]|nr:hypothetical protein [Flavobacteriales bacterium]
MILRIANAISVAIRERPGALAVGVQHVIIRAGITVVAWCTHRARNAGAAVQGITDAVAIGILKKPRA